MLKQANTKWDLFLNQKAGCANTACFHFVTVSPDSEIQVFLCVGNGKQFTFGVHSSTLPLTLVSSTVSLLMLVFLLLLPLTAG
jgi:hypothetical protein